MDGYLTPLWKGCLKSTVCLLEPEDRARTEIFWREEAFVGGGLIQNRADEVSPFSQASGKQLSMAGSERLTDGFTLTSGVSDDLVYILIFCFAIYPQGGKFSEQVLASNAFFHHR